MAQCVVVGIGASHSEGSWFESGSQHQSFKAPFFKSCLRNASFHFDLKLGNSGDIFMAMPPP